MLLNGDASEEATTIPDRPMQCAIDLCDRTHEPLNARLLPTKLLAGQAPRTRDCSVHAPAVASREVEAPFPLLLRPRDDLMRRSAAQFPGGDEAAVGVDRHQPLISGHG